MKKKRSNNMQSTRADSKISLYKLFWVFIIACVVGYVVESAVVYVKYGYIVSRQGLLYGPFNQVYGVGAVLMVVFLHKASLKHSLWIFFASALIGGGFEALSSLIQQSLFGSVSWDYSAQQFSILGGRTSLVVMFYWGVLGVVFMKGIYPHLMRFVDWIPKKQGHILSLILAIFFVFNIAISAAAVHRWSERVANVAPENIVDVYLDKHYPNALLQTVYPNMHFGTQNGTKK
jgi:uncharacterized membrane protein